MFSFSYYEWLINWKEKIITKEKSKKHQADNLISKKSSVEEKLKRHVVDENIWIVSFFILIYMYRRTYICVCTGQIKYKSFYYFEYLTEPSWKICF